MSSRQSSLALAKLRRDGTHEVKGSVQRSKNDLSRSRQESASEKIRTNSRHGKADVVFAGQFKTSKEQRASNAGQSLTHPQVSNRQQTPVRDDSINAGNDCSALDTTKEDTEADDFAGLQFCSQENGLNASGDDECEVRWDCYSPETVKQLRKLRGQHSVEGVKRIVANFNDAHVKPPKPTSVMLLPMYKPEPSAAFKEVSVRNRSIRTVPKRKASTRQAVQEMILLLQKKIEKQKEEEEAESPRVDQLSKKSDDNGEQDPNNNKGQSQNEKKQVEQNDCWSDDDLFQDNSFLIEATQNPEKFMNTSVDVSSSTSKEYSKANHNEKSSTKCGDVAQGNSPTLIPSSCVSKSSHVFSKPFVKAASSNNGGRQVNNCSKVIIVKKTPSVTTQGYGKPNQFQTQYNKTQGGKPSTSYSGPQTQNSKSSRPSSAYNAKFTTSVSKFANSNSQKPGINESKSSFTVLPPGANVKSSFRKFNSFQADTRLGDSKTPNSTNGSGTSNHYSSNMSNCSFKRTKSFDSSHSTSIPSSKQKPPVIDSNPNRFANLSTAEHQCHGKNSNPLSVKTEQLSRNGNLLSSKTTVSKATDIKKTATVAPPAPADDGFDISISEDVLQQLLEVDEVLDSQLDILATGRPTVTTSTSVTNAGVSHSSSATSYKPPISTSTNHISNVAANFSPIANTRRKSRTFVTGMRSSTPVRPNKQRAPSCDQVSNIPAKLAKSSKSVGHETTSSDSGSEFDSFLNEEVYESQILPFLEKIETEESSQRQIETKVTAPAAEAAPRQQPCIFSPSPVKCSPEEIEQKRQAALQRRSLRLSQMNNKTALR